VHSWLKDSKYSKTGKTLDVIPYKETEIYTKRVENYYSIYKMLYEKYNKKRKKTMVDKNNK